MRRRWALLRSLSSLQAKQTVLQGREGRLQRLRNAARCYQHEVSVGSMEVKTPPAVGSEIEAHQRLIRLTKCGQNPKYLEGRQACQWQAEQQVDAASLTLQCWR